MKVKAVVIGLALLALLAYAQPAVTITPLATAPGGVVTVYITGQAGEKCGVEIQDPFGNKVFVREITLAPDGKGSASWQVPTTVGLGTYTVYVSCQVSGSAAPATFRVTPVVGGEAKRDLSPLLITALAALGLVLAAVSFVKKFGKVI